jgi:hypothetical protein
MLHHVPAIIDPTAGDTLIELSISNDIHAAVDTWLQQSQAAIHKRITITPRMGPRTDAVRDGAQAIAMVEYIKDRIKAE